MTEILEPSSEGLKRAAELLQQGRLVAFPTETVYGLGADATSESAVQAIYEAKDRPKRNPIIVHVSGEAGARDCAAVWPEPACRLAARFWPGPLTMVVQASSIVSPAVLAGGDTVGLRCPAHPVAAAFLELCGVPVAAPSANSSGHLSPVEAKHVLGDLGGRIAAVLDGGACPVGIESTVIDLTESPPVLLRPGGIGRRDIEDCLGRSISGPMPPQEGGGPALRSPGLLSRHYAPRIPLRLRPREEVLQAPEGIVQVLLGDDGAGAGDPRRRICLPMDPSLLASRLYGVLWDCQESGAREIWMERPPQTEEWHAVNDRLARAAETEARG